MGHQALPGPEQRGERFPLHAAGRALAPPLYVSTALWQEEGQESFWRELFLSEVTGAPILGWSLYHGHILTEPGETLEKKGS